MGELGDKRDAHQRSQRDGSSAEQDVDGGESTEGCYESGDAGECRERAYPAYHYQRDEPVPVSDLG